MMTPITQSEPNNKYYTHTLVTALLHLQRFDQARPMFDKIAAADMVDSTITELLTRHELTGWLGGQ